MRTLMLPLPAAEYRGLIALRELLQYPRLHLELGLAGLPCPTGCPEWEQRNARIVGFVTRPKGEPLAPFSR